MKVTIKYVDSNSFTIEEVVKQAVHNYGEFIDVEVSPESTLAYDHIYFGLQQLITHTQLSLLFDKSANYQHELKTLRHSVQTKITEIIDQVIVDNETKVE